MFPGGFTDLQRDLQISGVPCTFWPVFGPFPGNSPTNSAEFGQNSHSQGGFSQGSSRRPLEGDGCR
jgi:hypothetical protein